MGTISKALKRYQKNRKAPAPQSGTGAASKDAGQIRKPIKSKGPVTGRAKPAPVSKKVSARPLPKTVPGLQPRDPARTGQAAAGAKIRPPFPDPALMDSDLISLREPDSPETKLFKYLRNKILFPQEGKPPRSIMVTSAMPGEGKSFIAANLAINMAQNIDEHVLIVDCDLRDPCMHRKFGFKEVMGLSEYLTGNIALSPLLMPRTSVKKLTLLPAGKTPDNPAEILSSEKMADLIDELTARYDDRYIIIDAPPPLVVPDTYAIVKKVDGIILVTNYRKTKLDLLEELVGEVGAEKIIGAVINRSRAHSSGRYGYRRLDKYSKYHRPH